MTGPNASSASRPKPPRKTGLSHFLAAASYSVGGFQRLLHEAAFRQELLALPVMLAVYWAIGATSAEFAVFAMLALLLIATEALNTAIECIVDHLTSDWAQFAKEAKDLGSLAVMCVLLSHGVLLVYVALT